MCTVTYIPRSRSHPFILTSNRDEKFFRPTIAPEIYSINNVDICFPKDLEKGGSWLAAGNNGRVVCLLNGAFISHKKQAFHLHSRGKVLVALAAFGGNVNRFFQREALRSVEPFTIISIEHKKGLETSFMEFIWDGDRIYIEELDPAKPAIWSSVTLYSSNERRLKSQMFHRFWKEHNRQMTPEKVYHFHLGNYSPDSSVDFLVEREDGLETVSITQVVPVGDGFRMQYIDLVNSTQQQLTV